MPIPRIGRGDDGRSLLVGPACRAGTRTKVGRRRPARGESPLAIRVLVPLAYTVVVRRTVYRTANCSGSSLPAEGTYWAKLPATTSSTVLVLSLCREPTATASSRPSSSSSSSSAGLAAAFFVGVNDVGMPFKLIKHFQIARPRSRGSPNQETRCRPPRRPAAARHLPARCPTDADHRRRLNRPADSPPMASGSWSPTVVRGWPLASVVPW